jgi:hypothetical protein
MDLDLKAFSLTLAVGLSAAAVCIAALYVTNPRRAAALGRAMLGVNGESRMLPLIALSVLLLAVGIVCEDLSRNSLRYSNLVAFGPQLRGILPSETRQRCDALLSEKSSCGKYDRGLVAMGAIGYGIWSVLGHLSEAGIASPGEVRVFSELQDDFSSEKCLPPLPWNSVCGSIQDLRVVSDDVYRIARSLVYANDNYYKDLEALRLRFDFERSLVFVLLAGGYLSSFLYLFEVTTSWWFRTSGARAAIAMSMAILLLLALADVLFSRTEAKFLCLEGSSCQQYVEAVRGCLLPLALLLVCSYRTRHMWRRAAMRVFGLANSNFSVVVSETEQRAWRMLQLMTAFGVLLLPTAAAYRSDQRHYVDSVYSYYETLRGAVLHCGVTLPCSEFSSAHPKKSY